MMRMLMLGNSFTYYHEMPALLSALTGAEVVAHTRGGAMLAEHLNPDTELGMKTLPILREQRFDYIVMQEQSNAPALHKAAFLKSVASLGELIHQNGAKPVMYATWAYREGTEKLASVNMSYAEMDQKLYDAYHEAAESIGALVADVGKAFTLARPFVTLYEADDYHPSEAGSMLAAMTIARTCGAI